MAGSIVVKTINEASQRDTALEQMYRRCFTPRSNKDPTPPGGIDDSFFDSRNRGLPEEPPLEACRLIGNEGISEADWVTWVCASSILPSASPSLLLFNNRLWS